MARDLLYEAFPFFYSKVIMQDLEGKFSRNINNFQKHSYMFIVFICVSLLDLMAYGFQWVK